MRKLSAVIAAIAGALTLGSCERGGAPWEHVFETMGTEVRVLIAYEETRRRPDDHFTAVEARLGEIAVDFYPWADGELAALNENLAAGRSFRASADLASLLSRAITLSAESDGRFDPGIGRLVALWGFDQAGPGVEATPPTDEAIADALEQCNSIRHVTVRSREISSDCRGPFIDLGGIARGFAVDQALTLLRRQGVANALVDAGGDVRALGRRGRQAWRVGIEHPRRDGIVGVVELATGEAAFTSGDAKRHFVHDGERFGHVLDPSTARPVRHTASVTVLAGSGELADAVSTALLVAGPDRWREVAERMGTRTVLRVDAAGWTDMTPGMEGRLQLAGPEAGSGNGDGDAR